MDRNYIPITVKRKYTTFKEAEEYLEKHKIKELFDFFMLQVIVHQPKELIPFLLELLDQCMLFKSGYQKPPLLFNKRHVQQIFKSFDVYGKKHISIDQYKSAMDLFGISDFDTPTLTAEGLVSQDVFETEVMKKLTDEFTSVIEPS